MSAPRNRTHSGAGRLARRGVCALAAFTAMAVVALAALGAENVAVRPAQPAASREQAAIPPQCLVCHDGALIAQQHLTRAAWSRELDKMIRWGAAVPAAEKDRAIDALSTAFGPARNAARPPAASPSGEAPASFTQSCLVCHDRDMIAQQRLTHAGWTREMDKMIRWGAPVPADQKTVLADYLASQYPVR